MDLSISINFSKSAVTFNFLSNAHNHYGSVSPTSIDRIDCKQL